MKSAWKRQLDKVAWPLIDEAEARGWRFEKTTQNRFMGYCPSECGEHTVLLSPHLKGGGASRGLSNARAEFRRVSCWQSDEPTSLSMDQEEGDVMRDEPKFWQHVVMRNVHQLRHERAWTLQNVADELMAIDYPISISRLSRLERHALNKDASETAVLPVDLLMHFAQVFEVSFENLLRMDGGEDTPE